MIDEKRVLEEIAGFKRCQKSENCDYLTGYISALSAIEGMIAEQPKVGEWIPCSERLPEDGENVLITIFNDVLNIGWFEVGNNIWRTYDYDCDDGQVIAWMPLPPAYKEEVNQ